MTTKLLILFIVMNVLNVIIQTVKSIATIKYGKTAAAIKQNVILIDTMQSILSAKIKPLKGFAFTYNQTFIV